MRSAFAALAAGVVTVLTVLAFASPGAHAGNLSIMNGQPVWTTGCTEPVAPPSVNGAPSNADAESVNQRMTAYNMYASQMQDFMNCVSSESQNDANATSRSIASNAQTIIDDAQAKVRDAAVRAQKRED